MPRALRLEYPGAIYHVMNRGDRRKISIAHRLRTETAVTLKWIARELNMGTWTHVANRLQKTKGASDANKQSELGLV